MQEQLPRDVFKEPTSLLAEVSEDNTHIPAEFSGFLQSRPFG